MTDINGINACGKNASLFFKQCSILRENRILSVPYSLIRHPLDLTSRTKCFRRSVEKPSERLASARATVHSIVVFTGDLQIFCISGRYN